MRGESNAFKGAVKKIKFGNEKEVCPGQLGLIGDLISATVFVTSGFVFAVSRPEAELDTRGKGLVFKGLEVEGPGTTFARERSTMLYFWIHALLRKDGFAKAVLLPAGALSLLRVILTWVGYALSQTPGVTQPVGYLMLSLSLPEAMLARGIRGRPGLWLPVVSGLIALGSFLWTLVMALAALVVSKRGSLRKD